MKIIIGKCLIWILLFSFLSPSSLFPQDTSAAMSTVKRIQEIVQELKQISQERENYLKELESMNSEREAELQLRIAELTEREKELNELKRNLELFGDLIGDQAVYYKSLSRKLTFWQIISGILATSLVTTLIVQGVSK